MDPKEIQRTLSLLGYDIGAIDGILGPITRGAVIRFQADAGLGVDGVVGRKTAAALGRLADRRRAAAGLAAVQHLSRFRLTHYYLAEEAAYGRNPIVPVLDRQGAVIALVDPIYFCNLALEGSGRLRDGRLLNVTGARVSALAHPEYAYVLAAARRLFPTHLRYAGIVVDQRGNRVVEALSFQVIPTERAGKGWTVQHGIPCDPFRTLAADLGAYRTSDPRFRGTGGLVPVGTRVFVLELAGASLPDGTTHDGWCVVNDTGGAIFGAHFDVFAGTAALAKAVRLPRIGHVWFDSSEARCPRDYAYGL